MDGFVTKLAPLAKKYAPVLLILALGLFLLLLPSAKSTSSQKESSSADPFEKEVERCEKRLTELLKSTAGVGRCEVLLTLSAGSRTLYTAEWETDESGEKTRVVLQKSGQDSYPVREQTVAPEYRGAVISCEGGNRAEVRLAVTEAVAGVTGLSSDRITVLYLHTS